MVGGGLGHCSSCMFAMGGGPRLPLCVIVCFAGLVVGSRNVGIVGVAHSILHVRRCIYFAVLICR